MWDEESILVHGGLDEVLKRLEDHDCSSPRDRHHSLTHVMNGTSAQIETTMQKVDTATRATGCVYTSIEDPERVGSERRYNVIVAGSISELRNYVRTLMGLVYGR